MKKIIGLVCAVVLGFAAMASVDVYDFKSTMHVYSLAKKVYVTTTFNGTMTVDTEEGTAVIAATKKDTKEAFTLTCDADKIFAIVSGKKDTVAAAYARDFKDETDDRLEVSLSGHGTAKTVVTGCGPCGGSTSCTKFKTIKGKYIGAYDCGCDNGQHYEYKGDCELPEERTTTVCPIDGEWTATLKTVDGAKYK